MLVLNFPLVGDGVRRCAYVSRNLAHTSGECPVPASHLVVETLGLSVFLACKYFHHGQCYGDMGRDAQKCFCELIQANASMSFYEQRKEGLRKCRGSNCKAKLEELSKVSKADTYNQAQIKRADCP